MTERKIIVEDRGEYECPRVYTSDGSPVTTVEFIKAVGEHVKKYEDPEKYIDPTT